MRTRQELEAEATINAFIGSHVGSQPSERLLASGEQVRTSG
jgi:hypothetical protein